MIRITEMTVAIDERLAFHKVESSLAETGFRVSSYEEIPGVRINHRSGDGTITFTEDGPSTYVYHLKREL